MIKSRRLVALATIFCCLTLGIYGQEKKEPITFSEKDRDSIVSYFSETKSQFEKEISGLTDEQLKFRPNQDSWTVAQVAEHIVITESAIFKLIESGPLKAPLNSDNEVFRARDLAVKLAITNRNQKFKAPEAVQPTQKLNTLTDLLSEFGKRRTKNINFLKSTNIDLRNHFADNPLMGVIDTYQWFLFLNAHTERHLAQIAEIKSNENFPKSSKEARKR